MKKLMMLGMVSMLLLAACGPGVSPEVEPDTAPVEATAVPTNAAEPYPAPEEPAVTTDTAYPAQVDASTLTPQAGDDAPQEAPKPGVPDQGQALSQMVSGDLAQRLGIDISDIVLLSQEAVDWSDSALGCPAPGMNYLQVITPGYKITLQAEGETYTFHTNEGDFFVLCGPKGEPIP